MAQDSELIMSSHWFSIETSSSQISLAIGEGEKCWREVKQIGNASMLIEPLCRELDIDFQKIDLCVIGQGPGSYNGLRVGYAFLKGLLCTNPIPVVQLATPFILAKQTAVELSLFNTTILVLNNARRNEIYAALIQVEKGLPKILWQAVASQEDLISRLPSQVDAVVSYDYQQSDLPLLKCCHWIELFPTASIAAQLAQQLALSAQCNLQLLEPCYVRSPV